MAEFDLDDLKEISKSSEVLDLLVEKEIIKKKKFLKQLAYEKELDALQYELLKMQEHIIKNQKRLLILYEGRDAAGKGGTISRTIAKLNPKYYKVSAVPKPGELMNRQWFFQRYIKNLPLKKEIGLFDRSWYNRAIVEPVFGFCTEKEYESFMKEVNPFERILQTDGIILIKFFLSISKKEQAKRLQARRDNPLKQFKIGGLDEKAIEKWDDYSHYINKMLNETGTEQSPWIEINTDSKKKARLETIKYILNSVNGFEASIPVGNDSKIVRIWQ